MSKFENELFFNIIYQGNINYIKLFVKYCKEHINIDKISEDDYLILFTYNDIELIKRAKDKGIKVVHELFITPNSGLIMLEEKSLFPNLEYDKYNDCKSLLLNIFVPV